MKAILETDPAAASPARFSVEVDSISRPEWEKQWARFADASLYHTWSYGQVSWGESSLSHLTLKQGSEIKAMAQVRIVKAPAIGGIAYVRWAPLFRLDGGWDLSLFKAALEALKSEYAVKRNLLVRIIPNIYSNDPAVEEVLAVLGSCGFERSDAKQYNTMRVDLSKSVEDLRKGLKQRWRNKLKNAEADGFAVSIGTSDAFYSRFHRAYDEMMTRKRFETTVSVTEFARLQSDLPEPAKMQILLAEKEGVLFNALVIGPGGDSGIYVLAATSDAGLKGDGAFVLQWRGMNLLKEKGCRWYDLGGANKDWNPGVYQFKSGMGGVEVQQLGVFEYCASKRVAEAIRLAESGVAKLKNLRSWLTRKPEKTTAPSEPASAPKEGASASKE